LEAPGVFTERELCYVSGPPTARRHSFSNVNQSYHKLHYIATAFYSEGKFFFLIHGIGGGLFVFVFSFPSCFDIGTPVIDSWAGQGKEGKGRLGIYQMCALSCVCVCVCAAYTPSCYIVLYCIVYFIYWHLLSLSLSLFVSLLRSER